MYFSGSFNFTNPDLPPYSKSKIRFELDLGFIEKMDSEH